MYTGLELPPSVAVRVPLEIAAICREAQIAGAAEAMGSCTALIEYVWRHLSDEQKQQWGCIMAYVSPDVLRFAGSVEVEGV